MPDAASPKRYRAFISYSHAADGRLAPALQKALHRFNRPWRAVRAMNVFRDQTNLSTSPGLWSSVQRELAASEFMILLASPEAARSKWVRKETDYWLAHASANNLLIVLTDGTIAYDEERGDFDWDKTTALPSNLAGVYDEEPNYRDMIWTKNATDLTLTNQRFREDVADLAAALYGKSKPDLLGEDLDRHQRQRRAIIAVVFSVLVLIIAAAGFAIRSAQQSRLANSGQLAASARSKVMTDPELALLLALESVNQSPTDDAVAALRETLIGAGTRIEMTRLRTGVYEASSRLAAREFHDEVSSRDDAVKVARTGEFELTLTRQGVAQPVKFGRHHADVNGVDISPDNRLVASVDQDGKGYVWDAGNGEVVFSMRPETDGFGYARALWSPDGQLLLTGGHDAQTQVWQRGTWQRLAVFGDMRGSVDLLAMSPDGRLVISGSRTAPYGAPVERAATVWETRTGHALGYRSDPGMVVDDVGFTSDGRLALIDYEGAIAELWNPVTKEVVATWNDEGLTILVDLERSMATLDAAGSDGSGEGVLGVVRLGFTADGQVLATVDSGSNVLLWETKSWTPLKKPDSERATIAAQAAPESSGAEARSPDGRWVAVSDGTRYVRVRRSETTAPLETVIAQARTFVTRALTPAERAEYIPDFWQQLVPWRFS